jgi:N utilization substance protein B
MTNQVNVPRREARESVFQFLYGTLPFPGGTGNPEGAIAPSRRDFDAFCESFVRHSDDFGWELASGAGQNFPAIDETISKLSTNWRLERMPRIDLTILRLSGYEILFRPDIPKTVSINEAVELAKKFGAEDSPSFVNGILDKIEKP